VTPRLVVVLDAPAGAAAVEALASRIPAPKRDRVVFAWPGAASLPPLDAIRAARAASFTRVRIRAAAGDVREDALRGAVDAGLGELEVGLPGDAPWDAIRELRVGAGLAFVSLSAPADALPPGNPCGADELAVRVEPGFDGWPDLGRRVDALAVSFRRLAVRGAPLCLLPGLDPARVISNAVEACGDPPATVLPFEAPDRAYFAPCGECSLALACDGMPVRAFVHPVGGPPRSMEMRAYGTGRSQAIELSAAGLADRTHPPGFLSGKAHVLGVLAGTRACGRMVVGRGEAARQIALLRRVGLKTATVEPDAAPADLDPGATTAPAGSVHVFFSTDDSASRAADLEREFTAAEAGKGMGADVFAREIGWRLGYPDCCVDAFVAAGKDATTADLLAASHRRSTRFEARLNVLDPRSPFALVPHVPCRFDCPASLAMADRVLAALPSLFPFIDRTALRLLARPALLLDGFVVFLDGTADPDGLGARYRSADAAVSRPGVPRDARADAFLRDALPSLAAGDRVRIEGRRLCVFDGAQVARTLECASSPLLFPFA
jgi:hypothetical protein